MACLMKKDNVYSPESTVSSLLANCNLHSNSSSLNSHSSVQYKDKLYQSASQALEAYIEDFDRSFVSPDLRPGKICITQSTSRDFRSSKDNFSHKYENLKQCETLNSVSSHLRRKAAYELDLLSLTTDDLLAFPADGSASFIQSSVLRPVGPGSNLNRKSQSASVSCFPHRTSSFGHKEELNLTKNPVSSLHGSSNRKMHTKHTFHKYDSGLPRKNPLIKQDPELVSHNYPRWLTSQKSDLSISGISSIPDFKYPAWLKSHNLLSDSSSENYILPHTEERDPTSLQNRKKLTRSQSQDRSNILGNSNMLDMEYKHDVKKNCQYDTPSQNFKNHMHLFKDDDVDLLLQKTRRTLDTSAEELTRFLKNDGSPCTVDVLEGERSWDNVPVGLRSPVPVCCEEENSLQSSKTNIVNGFLEDCLKNSSQESTFSGGNHHGPVEALKLMLFNLQAVQHSFNRNKTTGQNEEFKKTLDDDVEFNLCNHDTIPVRQSLQRALHHLSRLKGLVEDTVCKEESKEFTKT
ncbi:lung adenoma susceptibility protein 2 [Sceloporus undulatus]|uniref:lung adenoma susceptibility protein 2 n=1 Tax=Sceloporus undulatus TaxID=8520 RepID=UPI001C4AF42E|nr:lung adenoma susceptibility protein 2 [Sceloporus undulatus]XP_042311862.1 lung adenoma susceptibility protein 2 [Sceloporus undulatus]XP_042311863.1 lung adenoma susceptibility protein 2 [Sceloporus undulatus]